MSLLHRITSLLPLLLLSACFFAGMVPTTAYAILDMDGDGDSWPDSNGHTPPPSSSGGFNNNDDDDDDNGVVCGANGCSNSSLGVTITGGSRDGEFAEFVDDSPYPKTGTETVNGQVYDIHTAPNGSDYLVPRDNDDDDDNPPPPPPPLCTTGPNLVIEDVHFIKNGEDDLTKAVNATQLVLGDKYNPVVTIRNRGCLSTVETAWHKDQAPFGENGRFPVRSRIDYASNGSYTVSNINNNLAPISGTETRNSNNSKNPNTRLYKLATVTMDAEGNHTIQVTVDLTSSQASGQTCSGDWGCVKEAGTPDGNTRNETFTVTDPYVTLSSFMMPTSNTVSSAGNSSPRNISANQKWGLYWGGRLVDFDSCTGKGVTNRGDAINNFTGKKDTGGSSNALRAALPGSEDRTDINISEPGEGNSITYTITCNVLGSSQKVTDNVQLIHNRPLPICNSFTLSPASITSGAPIYLTWTSTNATQATISTGVGAVAVDGNRTLYPTRSSSYSLTLTNADGKSVGCPIRSVTVNPPPAPRCDTFNVSTSSITAGTPVHLTWTTTHATAVTISGGVGSVSADGSRTVYPAVTTTYTPTVTNAAGVSAQCTSRRVTVGTTTVPPASLTLAANSPVEVNDPINLVWASSNVRPGSCVASGAWTGTKADDGNESVRRGTAGDYTFTLTCDDLNDEPIDQAVTVRVKVPAVPECRNGYDDSDQEDILVDSLDPGCQDDPLDVNPGGYNADDDSETISQAEIDAIPEPTISLTASAYIVRYGDPVTVNYEINAAYAMSCELTSSDEPQSIPYTTPNTVVRNKVSQSNLQGTQEFTLTCTPEVIPGVPLPAVSRTMVVDVIPQAQEI
jgi:hypothetical protein